MKAFPEKDRHGKNSLKLKLISHNSSNTSLPPGTFDIKSEPLLSIGPIVCIGLNWNSRPLDNLKAQYPIPYRWPKKHLKIDVTIKLFVPLNLKSSLSSIPDIINEGRRAEKCHEKKWLSSKPKSLDYKNDKNSGSSISSSNIPTAPSLMEPY